MCPVGGAAELGVFPAFLWAKHAAWLALERHTRRVKHSALSCLKAGARRKGFHWDYANFPFHSGETCKLRQEPARIFFSAPEFEPLHVYVCALCDAAASTGEVMDPITSSQVSPPGVSSGLKSAMLPVVDVTPWRSSATQRPVSIGPRT